MAWIESPRIEFDSTGRFTLYVLGDFQLGSSSCNKKLIANIINEVVADKRSMSVFLGDIEDNDRPSTRALRYKVFSDRKEVLTCDGEKHLAWVDKEVLPLLLPLAKTELGIVGVLAGHHWTQLTPTLNSVQYTCGRLTEMSGKKVPYMGEMSGWLEIDFVGTGKYKGKTIRKTVHMQHGAGGGQTLSSALNKLERTSQGFFADAYIRGHDCKLVSAKTTVISPSHKRGKPHLESRDLVLLNIGSSTRGYNLTLDAPDYVEMGMMRPTAMGWGALHFDIQEVQEGPGKPELECRIRVEL
jgi:hypothetical protein